jgi:integrase/recombinase XerD
MAKKLREQLNEEMVIRGRAEWTKKGYMRAMERFLEFHKGSPQSVELDDVKRYVMHLINVERLAPRSVNNHLAGIIFFYRHVMRRPWYPGLIPRMKAPKNLPVPLTQEEVELLINSVNNVMYKAVIMTLYSAGLRNSEVRNLRVTDIDSKQMVIHVRQGKGGKDREALLSPTLLKCLRTYWKLFRAKNPVQSEWLFIPTKNTHSGELKKKFSHTALAYVLKIAVRESGIKKKSTRTSCGTPLRPTYLNAA